MIYHAVPNTKQRSNKYKHQQLNQETKFNFLLVFVVTNVKSRLCDVLIFLTLYIVLFSTDSDWSYRYSFKRYLYTVFWALFLLIQFVRYSLFNADLCAYMLLLILFHSLLLRGSGIIFVVKRTCLPSFFQITSTLYIQVCMSFESTTKTKQIAKS